MGGGRFLDGSAYPSLYVRAGSFDRECVHSLSLATGPHYVKRPRRIRRSVRASPWLAPAATAGSVGTRLPPSFAACYRRLATWFSGEGRMQDRRTFIKQAAATAGALGFRRIYAETIG